MSKRRSLSIQLFLGVLRSLLAGCVVFAALVLIGDQILDRTVYAEAFEKQMSGQQFARLQSFVEREGVTADHLRPLDIWCSQVDQIYLALYLSGQKIYETPMSSDDTYNSEDAGSGLEDPERAYVLKLSDGSSAEAFLYYYAGDAYYYLMLMLSGVGAFFVFSLCFITFVHRKMRYIQQMKRELDILAGGDLTYPVTITGSDELTDLAEGINQMRQSILSHQAAEEQIRSANAQLVTAMSHDLRTPLTSLLAYLELMERGKYQDPEQLSLFIRKSLDKTLQIRAMADKLFEYFFVYSSEWEAPALEYTDVDSLLQHMLGEYRFSLESQGFSVVMTAEEIHGQARLDMDMLRRAFDNLYSNLLKYADPSETIRFSCWRDGTALRLRIVNGISPLRDKKQSTSLGLNTCRRILQCQGGDFSCREEQKHFVVEITLPLIAAS